MTDKRRRVLPVSEGTVQCTPLRREEIEKCRFCVHSTGFFQGDRRTASPARAYCAMQRTTTNVVYTEVTAVECDDLRGEGFRSMMNVIS
ncbi:MAG: hypothetical protein GKC04_03775 [Methanomicrobiales archaeon]|nr:hypothetical protein [Methanomicrobiales archaeon]